MFEPHVDVKITLRYTHRTWIWVNTNIRKVKYFLYFGDEFNFLMLFKV